MNKQTNKRAQQGSRHEWAPNRGRDRGRDKDRDRVRNGDGDRDRDRDRGRGMDRARDWDRDKGLSEWSVRVVCPSGLSECLLGPFTCLFVNN